MEKELRKLDAERDQAIKKIEDKYTKNGQKEPAIKKSGNNP